MEKFNKTAEEIRQQSDLEKFRKKPVLFGAGDCGHKIYDMLQAAGIKPSCFCDNKVSEQIDAQTGLPIVRPEALKDKIADSVVLVCVVEDEIYQSMYKQLLALGVDDAQIYRMRAYYDRLSMAYFEENIEKYKTVYQFLEDEFSREVYLARMRKAFLLSDIAEIVSPGSEEYFDEKIRLTDEEVFIDCGGFDGDTSMKFIERCGGKYKDIVIFEPEQCKIAAIENRLQGYQYHLFQLGVWSNSARLHFDALETDGSHVSEQESGYTIKAVALDEMVYDRNPTFIKMDIEGSEKEALKGCGRIIKEYKPKLAVCIYHKPEDLFELPLMIKEMNPAYRLYVRQYSNSRFETVLYAV